MKPRTVFVGLLGGLLASQVLALVFRGWSGILRAAPKPQPVETPLPNEE